MEKKKCLVVLSGGQDSTTVLYWAIEKYGLEQVDTLTFDYGQRHIIELESATKIAEFAKVPNKIISINTFNELGGNALTDKDEEIDNFMKTKYGLPNTFVPGRNLIFLTFAAAYAFSKQITEIITGVAQTDYSGYPDCRRNTMDSLEKTVSLGMESDFKIHTPLMNLTKAETVKLAEKVGALEALKWSHTCYNGEYPPCGKCPACILREKGFKEAGIIDPILNRGE